MTSEGTVPVSVKISTLERKTRANVLKNIVVVLDKLSDVKDTDSCEC